MHSNWKIWFIKAIGCFFSGYLTQHGREKSYEYLCETLSGKVSCSFLISCSHATIFFSSSFLFCSLTPCEKRDGKCLCLLTQHSVTVSTRAKSTARAGLDIVCTWHRGNASGERGKLQCLRHLILTNGAQYLWGMLWVRIRKKKNIGNQ